MDKIVKDLANKAIEREYIEVSDNATVYFGNDGEEEKISDELYKIMNKISCALPDEYKNLIDELESSINVNMGITERKYFKQGVIKGLTGLKYLEEIGQEILLV